MFQIYAVQDLFVRERQMFLDLLSCMRKFRFKFGSGTTWANQMNMEMTILKPAIFATDKKLF